MSDRRDQTPAISVILPVWNRAGLVREAIDSVLAQDFEDWELVVVDDGSQDGTAAAIATVDDPRIRGLRLPSNRGAGAARNRGAAAARAELVCFLDSDDLFLPGKLGHVFRWFAAHPGHDVLVDSFRVARPSGCGRADARRVNPELRDGPSVERAVFDRSLWKATPALSVRREALLAIGGFDETLQRRQDMDLLLRLAARFACASTSAELWIKRPGPDSISARDDFLQSVLDICERHPRYRATPEFRRGLGRDLARHLAQPLARGDPGAASRRLRRLREALGTRETAALLGLGALELVRRSRAWRAIRPAEPLAAPREAARSGA